MWRNYPVYINLESVQLDTIENETEMVSVIDSDHKTPLNNEKLEVDDTKKSTPMHRMKRWREKIRADKESYNTYRAIIKERNGRRLKRSEMPLCVLINERHKERIYRRKRRALVKQQNFKINKGDKLKDQIALLEQKLKKSAEENLKKSNCTISYKKEENETNRRYENHDVNNESTVGTKCCSCGNYASPKFEHEPKKKPIFLGPILRNSCHVKRYMVQIPKSLLPIKTADAQELRQRYNSLYIPSDFFLANVKWSDTITPDKPFSLKRPCQFHIMNEMVENPTLHNPQLWEPPDANYLYSAKVMLLSLPPINEIYKKCFGNDVEGTYRNPIHPWRLINFLVGVEGDVDTMAIGGPWSPSLDGKNPDKDPSVLIRTAIRTCKALTGINLSNCNQWYRFVEINYHRERHKEDDMIETVVIYLPDVHSCMANIKEWDTLTKVYKNFIGPRSPAVAFSAHIKPDVEIADFQEKSSGNNGFSVVTYNDTHEEEKKVDVENTTSSNRDIFLNTKKAETLEYRKQLKPEKFFAGEKNQDKMQMDSKNFTYLNKNALNDIEEQNQDKKDKIKTSTSGNQENPGPAKKKKTSKNAEEINENKNTILKPHFILPTTPHIIVHPNRQANGGKFNCAVKSLSELLDCDPYDSKERSFEVSLFSELFNDMLMRDFGFNVYKEMKLFKEMQSTEEVCEVAEAETKTPNDIKTNCDKDVKMEILSEKKSCSCNSGYSGTNRTTNYNEQSVASSTATTKFSGEDNKLTFAEKKIMVTNPQLLLSFTYFDINHCGYIHDTDLENLFFILGLNLSRSHIRKLLNKFGEYESPYPIFYRKLTHMEVSLESATDYMEDSQNDSKDCYNSNSNGGDYSFNCNIKTERNDNNNI